MAATGSKSREVIYGGRIIGARIRAEGAQETAKKADRTAAELWSIQMEAYRGPAQPSPTIGQFFQHVGLAAICLTQSVKVWASSPVRKRARHALGSFGLLPKELCFLDHR
jgi:hypothetical protein